MTLFKFFPAILCIILSTQTSCDKILNNDKESIKKEKITGVVQKGPYIDGSQVGLSELNDNLEKTGKVYNSTTSDNAGNFEFTNLELVSPYVEISGSGFFYNEVLRALSSSQLTLYSLVDVSARSAFNVNVLTHLARKRVEFLVANDSSFLDASRMAQEELVTIFGLQPAGMDMSDMLDISKDGEDNAILLGISLILLGNRTPAEFSELLAKIASDIEKDGRLDDATILPSLRASTINLNKSSIRQALENRYKEMGLDKDIPDFESVINRFLNFTALKPTAVTNPATNYEEGTATLHGDINPNSLQTKIIFQFGKTTAYGDSILATPGLIAGDKVVKVTALLSNLEPLTTYHFRIKAENELGVVYGSDRSFNTPLFLPTVTTKEITGITFTTADGGGNVIRDGGSPVTARGVVFRMEPNPTVEQVIEDDVYVTVYSPTNNGSGLGEFTSDIFPLFSNSTYYVRAYATNEKGTAYGNQVTVTTPSYYSEGSGITDIDGNFYNTIIINGQEWMKENLRVSRYSNGDSLPNVSDTEAWWALTSGAYCYFFLDSGYNKTWGKLYNGYAVQDARKLCPSGWHVPTDDEWKQLEIYLGMSKEEANKTGDRGFYQYVGAKLKDRTFVSANFYNISATNDSGFSGLGAGFRTFNWIDWGFPYDAGYDTRLWGVDPISIRSLNIAKRTVGRGFSGGTTAGYSLRCIKDK